MNLYAVLRSYGGENNKGRPPWFSKDLVLASFLRALEVARDAGIDVRPVFANDGPLPQRRAELMERYGTVVYTENGPVGLLDSYRFALDLPERLGMSESDVVCFVEDDYLLAADAFVVLARAGQQLTEVSYFALSGVRPSDPGCPEERRAHGTPREWQPAPDLCVDGIRWINIMSITSTFAARVGALRQDRDIHELSMKPFRNRFLDHELCLMYQGIVPYHGREFLFGLGDDFVPSLRGVLRAVFLLPFRFEVNRRARAQRTPHHLYGVTPRRAAHAEDGQIPDGPSDYDWDAQAAAVTQWASAHGVPAAG